MGGDKFSKNYVEVDYRIPDPLDANESTWAFVAVYCVGLEGNPQANGLEPLASNGGRLNYCGRTADESFSRIRPERERALAVRGGG
jgi:hypothetical protein